MLGLALGFSVGLDSLYLGVGIIGEEKCGDEGEEGERFGATSSKLKLKLFPHTLSMGVGIIGGKRRETLGRVGLIGGNLGQTTTSHITQISLHMLSIL